LMHRARAAQFLCDGVLPFVSLGGKYVLDEAPRDGSLLGARDQLLRQRDRLIYRALRGSVSTRPAAASLSRRIRAPA
jgi:hypothetical protein